MLRFARASYVSTPSALFIRAPAKGCSTFAGKGGTSHAATPRDAQRRACGLCSDAVRDKRSWVLPSPRPKTPQRLLSAEFLFVLRFARASCVSTPSALFIGAPAQKHKKIRGKAGTTLQRIALFDVKIDAVLGGVFP